MAQNPLLVDQIQIEPGSAGTRVIRKALDGSLEFVDGLNAGGLTLSQLAGWTNVQNLLVVGVAGAGTSYTTIQGALDAIPAGASETNPYTVLIAPGVYKETLTIIRNGVSLIGLGGVYLKAAEDTPNGPGADHTVIIQAGGGTIPRRVVLQNLNISNVHDTYACVRIIGGAGSFVGSTGIELDGCSVAPVATGGNLGVYATSINVFSATGCTISGDTGLSLWELSDCAQGNLLNCTLPGLVVSQNSAGTLPAQTFVGVAVQGCVIGQYSSLATTLQVTLLGAGSFTLEWSSVFQNAVADGDQVVVFRGSSLPTLAINTTTQVLMSYVSHSTVTGAVGTTMAETRQTGLAGFVSVAFVDVVFAIPQPDTNYAVAVEFDANPLGGWWVTTKTTTGFRINLPTSVSLNAGWVVTRDI